MNGGFTMDENNLVAALRWRVLCSECCCVPEVVGAVPLAKATPWYEADPGLLQHLHAVKHIRLLTLGLTKTEQCFRFHIQREQDYFPDTLG